MRWTYSNGKKSLKIRGAMRSLLEIFCIVCIYIIYICYVYNSCIAGDDFISFLWSLTIVFGFMIVMIIMFAIIAHMDLESISVIYDDGDILRDLRNLLQLSESEVEKICRSLNVQLRFETWKYEHYNHSYLIVKKISELDKRHLEFALDTVVKVKSIFPGWTQISSLIISIIALFISMLKTEGINEAIVVPVLVIFIEISITLFLVDRTEGTARDEKMKKFYLTIIQRVLTETEQKGS